MTDKQIIIDGCDVSGCDRLNIFPMQYGEPHEICLTSLEQWGGQEKYCKDRPNCYYKQLKAKEQECEELKTMQKDLSFENQKFCYQIEELTKQLEPFKDEYFKGLDNVTIAELAKKSIRITAENCKLEQTLTEIKEIADGMHDLWINKTPYTDINNLVVHLLECELNRIRYKIDDISEVLDEI